MNLSDDLRQELDDLLERLCAGGIDQPRLDRLQAIVLGSTEARDLYLEAMRIHHGLEWLFRDPKPRASQANAAKSPVAPSSPRPNVPTSAPPVTKSPRRQLSASSLALSVLAASLVFAAYFVGISWDMLGRNRHAPRAVAQLQGNDGSNATSGGADGMGTMPAISTVATVTDTADAEWASSSPAAAQQPGCSVTPGDSLSITAGLVELELKQGTKLLIEGPADWTIDGNNNATLKRGKLVAQVPQQAIGFTLNTPTAKIVDLGTEFGVEVADDGNSTVSVVKGKVDALTKGGRSLVLRAGEAVHLERGKPARLFPADNSKFAAMKKQLTRDTGGLLFSDNFNGTAHSLEINPDAARDDPDRFGGLLGRLSYVESRPQEDWSTQLNHPEFPFPGALLVAANAQNLTSVSPNVNFAMQRPQGVRFTVECDMKPLVAEENGKPLDSWGAIVFASEKSEAAHWDPGLMALLVRPNGGYAVADSSDGVFQEIKSGQLSNDDHPSKSGWHQVRIRYTVIRFDGTEPSDVEIEIDGKQIAKFTSKRSPRANYLALNAYTASGVASCGFDNLQVRCEPLGEERQSKVNRVDRGQRSGISPGRVANRKLSET